jgi:hypothetical protein
VLHGLRDRVENHLDLPGQQVCQCGR